MRGWRALLTAGWLSLTAALAFAAPVSAACLRHVAEPAQPLLWQARAPVLAQIPAESVGITYVGHSTFLIETAQGVRIATDYNDYVRPAVTPDIVTMNIAHSTHYSTRVEPGVKHALQGWGTPEKAIEHDLAYGDVQVRNVPTNIRDAGTTLFNGNSIFVFETAGLCIAHLGHLHHRLTPQHLAQLGQIDILFVPVDGVMTLGQNAMLEVVEQIMPQVVIPMHFFGEGTLLRFVDRLVRTERLAYEPRFHDKASIVYSRATLPERREVVVLPGRM